MRRACVASQIPTSTHGPKFQLLLGYLATTCYSSLREEHLCTFKARMYVLESVVFLCATWLSN